MRRQVDHYEQAGYLTFAQNSEEVDYLRLAYLQALSIKATQQIKSYAVVVDAATNDQVTDKHRAVFDYIIRLPTDEAQGDGWKLANEWQAWNLTPFKETIKLDSDILFTKDIMHWWHAMRMREVCCTTRIRDYEGNVSTEDFYRKVFVRNHLPNVYSGFTYFRYSRFSMEFYRTVQQVYHNWPYFRDRLLKNCRQEKANTDEAYAIAALIMGEEKCTLPLDIPTFVHMKGVIQKWNDLDWTEHVYAQVDSNLDLTVGFNRQSYPFHYVQKKFATDEIIEKYEQRVLESNS